MNFSWLFLIILIIFKLADVKMSHNEANKWPPTICSITYCCLGVFSQQFSSSWAVRMQDSGSRAREQRRLAGSTIGLGTGRGNWRSRSLNLLHFGRDKWHRGTALRFQFPIAWHPGWQTPCPALKMVRPETSHLGLWMCINYQDIISLPGQRSQGEISQWMGHVS